MYIVGRCESGPDERCEHSEVLSTKSKVGDVKLVGRCESISKREI